MTAFNQETYSITYPHLQYHYTLYYYDQSGNLIQTVPPAGVNINSSPLFLNSVKLARDNNTTGAFPSHNMATRYKFNTLNQLTWQNTPDGGESEFWYDKVGRLVVSKNAKQNLTTPKSYSYTNFDALGRITEVGEMQSATTMSVALAFSPIDLSSFINSSNKKEVTRTFYDVPFGSFPSSTQFVQNNMRGRVSSIQYFENLSSGASVSGTYSQAVHYAYDIHGNVNVLMREMPSLNTIGQAYKTTHYYYDLVSGKVNEVIYQKQQADQFAHKYTYDGDNRIVSAYTSTNLIHWDRDAHYQYYLHGPLKRTELGELKVQGLDYAYTLHGWLKGVNSNTMQSSRDMGKDAEFGGVHEAVAKDAFGYSLHYFDGDYQAIGNMSTSNHFLSEINGSDLQNASQNLYNGNIKAMITCLPQASAYNASKTINPEAFGNAYKYDQLNRLMSSRTFTNLDYNNNQWQNNGIVNPQAYATNYTYDAMGNILTQKRNGAGVAGLPLALDDLTYNYHTNNNGLISNRLYLVDDNVSNSNYTDDIDDQGIYNNNSNTINTANNYGYDELGNLIRDNAEQIANIEWTVQGKIKKITRTIGSPKPNLEFGYDATGQRLWKKVIPSNGLNIKTYYYLRDAQGNSMANYTKYINNANELMFVATEHSIYGSSRLGIDNRMDTLFKNNTYNPAWYTNNKSVRNLGLKSYELSNHLGNVLVTVSDKKVYIIGPLAVSFEPEITTISDYYPFGSAIASRGYSSGAYRYGFNGKEKDEESFNDAYDFGARIYDGRLGRWFSLDPLMKEYPKLSPYNFVDNEPINSKDADGRDIIVLCAPIRPGHPTGHQAILVGNDKDGWSYYSFDGFSNPKNKNNGITNEVPFKSLQEFANSEYNSYQENYDANGYADAERDGNGKIIQRYELGYKITTDAATDEKMKSAAKTYLNTHSYFPGINDCTDIPKVALDAAGLKNGEYTVTISKNVYQCDEFGQCEFVDVVNRSPNYLPETKQKEIATSNSGTDVDNSLKRTTTEGNSTPTPIPVPDNIKYQQDNTQQKTPIILK